MKKLTIESRGKSLITYFFHLMLCLFVSIFISNAIAPDYLNLLGVEFCSIAIEQDHENKEEKEQEEETEKLKQDEFITTAIHLSYYRTSNGPANVQFLYLEKLYQEVHTPPPEYHSII